MVTWYILRISTWRFQFLINILVAIKRTEKSLENELVWWEHWGNSAIKTQRRNDSVHFQLSTYLTDFELIAPRTQIEAPEIFRTPFCDNGGPSPIAVYYQDILLGSCNHNLSFVSLHLHLYPRSYPPLLRNWPLLTLIRTLPQSNELKKAQERPFQACYICRYYYIYSVCINIISRHVYEYRFSAICSCMSHCKACCNIQNVPTSLRGYHSS